jgi:hypothetical protein
VNETKFGHHTPNQKKFKSHGPVEAGRANSLKRLSFLDVPYDLVYSEKELPLIRSSLRVGFTGNLLAHMHQLPSVFFRAILQGPEGVRPLVVVTDRVPCRVTGEKRYGERNG